MVAPLPLIVIWPVLDEFCRRHPLVEPDVQLDDRIGNWVEDRVDVGFRSGYPPEGGVVALTAAQLGYMLEGIDWRNPQHTWRPASAG